MARYQQPAEQRHDGNDAEFHELVKGERLSPRLRRNELGQQRIDGHLLQADADARDQSPQIDPERSVLERHDRRGRPNTRAGTK